MKKNVIYLLIILFLLIFVSPNPNISQINSTNNSYWLFTTGNETMDGYRMWKLGDGNSYNSSYSSVSVAGNIIDRPAFGNYEYNATADYYYTDNGFMLGFNSTSLEVYNGDWYKGKGKNVFSSIDTKNHTAIFWTEINGSTSFDGGFTYYLNYTQIYNFEYFSLTKYTLSNKDIIEVYPFEIRTNNRDLIGTNTWVYTNKTVTDNLIGDGWRYRSTIYDNGTVSNMTEQFTNTGMLITGYFAPSLFKAIDIVRSSWWTEGLSLNSINSIKLDQSLDPDNKILLDYYIDEEYYDEITTVETSSEETSTSTISTIEETTTSTISTSLITDTSIQNKDTISTKNETPIFPIIVLSSVLITIVILRRYQVSLKKF